MTDDIFVDMIQGHLVIVYMDDILVFTKDLKKHREVVREVLKRLREHKLYLKPEKCVFEQNQVDFLGLVVKDGHVSMDPIKTKAIDDWPVPKNLKEVRSFMQFCNFYRAFIPDFAGVTVPFNELTKKNVKFKWGPRQQHALDTLKNIIDDDVVLMLPVPGARFRLEVDASDYACGAVLHQIVDNKPRPVAFFSKTLQPAERNYQIYDKEMLAMMLALQNWRQFLRNAPEFDLWSDHQNLQYFREPQKLNRRQARWATELSEYHMKLHHRPGKLNMIADILSRTYRPEGGIEDDNSNMILLKPELFDMHSSQPEVRSLAFTDKDHILDSIRRRRSPEHRDTKVTEGLKSNPKDFTEVNGIVKYKELIYVPHDKELRRQIVWNHHSTPIAGHPGRHKTAELIQRNYWWPGLPGWVAKFVKECDTCQRNEPRVGPISAPLHPHKAPEQPWEDISVDLIGPLPKSRGFDMIFVCVDRLTKAVVTAPCNQGLSSEGTAHLFLNNVFKRFGWPKKVTSDRGPQFVSNFMIVLNKMTGVQGNPSTAYHPQTDGLTECANHEVIKYLRMWVNA